jgi:hypothetical protein
MENITFIRKCLFREQPRKDNTSLFQHNSFGMNSIFSLFVNAGSVSNSVLDSY